MSLGKDIRQQTLGIGGSNFTVHAKVITTNLPSRITRRHGIGAQKDHIQHMGVGSKEIHVEGFTTVPYYESNLWIIELLQRWGKPIPFVSNSISTLAYIENFEYRESAERFQSLTFTIRLVEAQPFGSIIGEVVQRIGSMIHLLDGKRPIIIGGVLTGGEGKPPKFLQSDK